MDKPVVAQYKPYYVDVVKGERYFWCSCGLSKNQPWCDQSHAGTGFKPIRYVAEKNGSMLFCGCKHTRSAPFCDGSHNDLQDEYEGDPRPIEELLAISTEVSADRGGRALLDGGCYVQQPSGLAFEHFGVMAVAPVIDEPGGARYLGQYYAEVPKGDSTPVACDGSEVVLFGIEGEVEVEIAGHREVLSPQSGVYVAEGEAFSVHNRGEQIARLLLTVCPVTGRLAERPVVGDNFNGSLSERRVARDDSKRSSMADRFYQVLVGEESGSREVTQFIGQIPQSKAAPHHHLYEEAIIILAGEGVLWTETRRTPVAPGDMIFLPARQQHSLQCTSAGGLLLGGHFYPSGSPAINY